MTGWLTSSLGRDRRWLRLFFREAATRYIRVLPRHQAKHLNDVLQEHGIMPSSSRSVFCHVLYPPVAVLFATMHHWQACSDTNPPLKRLGLHKFTIEMRFDGYDAGLLH